MLSEQPVLQEFDEERHDDPLPDHPDNESGGDKSFGNEFVVGLFGSLF